MVAESLRRLHGCSVWAIWVGLLYIFLCRKYEFQIFKEIKQFWWKLQQTASVNQFQQQHNGSLIIYFFIWSEPTVKTLIVSVLFCAVFNQSIILYTVNLGSIWPCKTMKFIGINRSCMMDSCMYSSLSRNKLVLWPIVWMECVFWNSQALNLYIRNDVKFRLNLKLGEVKLK